MNIHSGYRNPRVNAAVDGVWNSAHAQGYAFDFDCPGAGSNLEVARKLAQAVKDGRLVVDQIIYEGGWVHVSRDLSGAGAGHPRGMLLTLTGSNPNTYAEGLFQP